MADMLHFDHEKHVYTLLPKKIVLPSVSEIIRPLSDFSRIPQATLEFARARGVAVHKACELHDLGTLDEDDLDDQLLPYLDGWKKFCADHNPVHTLIEHPLYHDTMLYAGTPDRVSAIGGRTIVLDIKATATLNPAVAVQLSAYGMMAARYLDQNIAGYWSVRLLPSGGYEIVNHANATSTFIACHNVFNWKRKNA